jgi:cell division protein YceG involved in septum cleavage
MKKLWSKYSYAILLIGLSFVLTFVFAERTQSSINENYLSITVEEGDSLWQLSKSYYSEHQLSPEEFINWVKKNNQIDEELFAGESIIIPVKKNEIYVASSSENE